MRVSGSAIAAYYAGNAALALDRNRDQDRDRQAAQQSQAAARQRLQQFRQPQPLSEQVLEGELLNKGPQAQLDSGLADEESAPQHPLPTLSTNPAIRHYQTTARLDGIEGGKPIHQLDIHV